MPRQEPGRCRGRGTGQHETQQAETVTGFGLRRLGSAAEQCPPLVNGWLHPTTSDDLAVRVDPLSENGVDTVVDLPTSPSASVTNRVGTMNLLRLGIAATSSMLDHDDPRSEEAIVR